MRTAIASIAAFLVLGPLQAFAAPPPGPPPAPPSIIRGDIEGCDFQTGRLTAACIPNFIASVVIFIYSLIGIFFIGNIMYAGYQIALAGAGIMDEGAGKQRLKWAIIGFMVTACSFLILSAIVSVFSEPFSGAPPAPPAGP